MTSKKQREIVEIKNMLLQMSGLVEEGTRTAILACQQQNPDLAHKVIERDWEIDKMEVQIDSLVLKTLALQQPMAADLRFLTAAMEIAEQLERVGDHSVNISEQVTGLMKKTDIIPVTSAGLRDMASIAINMLGDSINAFVYSDPEMARTVRNRDNEVDDLYARVVEEEIGAMEKSRSEVRPGVYNIILALNIERIADLATNIAEDVIYLVDGRMIRHGEEEEPFEAPSDLIKGGPPGESKRREPLECLERHADLVHQCLEQTALAARAYMDGHDELFEKHQTNVNQLEKAADLIKRNVRAHLPRGLIMPIDKFELFLYLNEQDGIADTAEDILEWLSYKRPVFSPEFREEAGALLDKCLKISESLRPMLHAARTYFQTGNEEVRVFVKDTIRALRKEEHDADMMEHQLKSRVFSINAGETCSCYLLRLVELIGESADRAEDAADILRSMIAR
jgi:phosphate transport system protein